MTDYDIHSCGYYCNRPACIEVQRNELRDKLFEIRTSERNIQTSDKETPESSQPTEPTIDGWPLWSGLPQPEPVAYIDVETRNLSWAKLTRWETPTVVKMDKVPLYTAPPKKEWVGLTLQEIEYIEGMTLDRHDAIRMAAAALQEKNNG
jgi:hypothetical protein